MENFFFALLIPLLIICSPFILMGICFLLFGSSIEKKYKERCEEYIKRQVEAGKDEKEVRRQMFADQNWGLW